LWFATGQSTILVKGGTHNGLSPSFDFYKEVFCPLLPVKTDAQLLKYGFYPSGGGEVFVKVDPNFKRLSPLIILDRGMLLTRSLSMTHSKAFDVCGKINDQLQDTLKCRPIDVEAIGKGMPVLAAQFQYSEITEIITVYHQRDIPKTAAEFTKYVTEYQNASAPVDEHLADQLLLSCALISGGTYKATSISKYSKHFETNVMIIQMFLGQRIYVKEVSDGVEVRIC